MNARVFRRHLAACAISTASVATSVCAQDVPVSARKDSVSVRLIDTELRVAVQMLGQYLDRPVLFSGTGGGSVTIETPRPIPRIDVPRLLRGLLEGNGYEFVDDTASRLYRARPRSQASAMNSNGLPAIAPQATGEIELHVLALQHARAEDVASTVSALYGTGAGQTFSISPSLADQLRGNLIPPQGGAPDRPVDAIARGTGELSGSLAIVADMRTNSLLVRANASDVALVRSVIEALDKRPLQVLIEVLVAEVRRDKSIGMNVDAELGPTGVGRSGATVEGAIGEAGLGDFALRVMGIGGLDLDATLRLASGQGSVRILTRPVVLATNNELAEIIVGSQRPFVQVQRSLPTDNVSRDQIVQYRDVGTKLSVRPTISTDGTVQLEVMQEVSTATSELAFNAPVIATRSVRTQLLVRDGQTVALGGLTDQLRERRRGGFPLLSAIPGLGGLFGRASSQTIETELFVFLTPRVIRTDDDAMRLSDPLRKKVEDRP